MATKKKHQPAVVTAHGKAPQLSSASSWHTGPGHCAFADRSLASPHGQTVAGMCDQGSPGPIMTLGGVGSQLPQPQAAPAKVPAGHRVAGQKIYH